MTLTGVRVAVTVVRWWTRVYTCALPPAVAVRRRAEIESDLWELQHDVESSRSLQPAAHICIRALLGAADDVWWAAEHGFVRPSIGLGLRRAVMVAATALLITSVGVIPLSSGKSDRSRRQDGVTRMASPAAPPPASQGCLETGGAVQVLASETPAAEATGVLCR